MVSGLARTLSALALIAHTRGALSPTWVAGSGWLSPCGGTTTVLGVVVCATPAAFQSAVRTKLDHIANVLAQLLDNDADGNVDAPDVVNYMINNKFYMWVAATESDSESASMPDDGKGQLTGIWESVPNCCDTPSNRGASNTDRSTWAAAKDTTSGCSTDRDA